jgi:hypothetical protein
MLIYQVLSGPVQIEVIDAHMQHRTWDPHSEIGAINYDGNWHNAELGIGGGVEPGSTRNNWWCIAGANVRKSGDLIADRNIPSVRTTNTRGQHTSELQMVHAHVADNAGIFGARASK